VLRAARSAPSTLIAELKRSAKMKPRFYHYIVAHYFAIVSQVGGVFLVSANSVACASLWDAPRSFSSCALFVVAVAAAYPLGAFLFSFAGGLLYYPIVCWLMGAPFSAGDSVVILTGRRKGQRTVIYEVWASRNQIRLRLSDDERESVADVYSYHQVVKTKQPNQ
jgi:hypothetical protein